MAPTAQPTGLETFGGGTGGSFGQNPNLTTSNALSGTPFLGGVANAGVGTGNLGQFGGYIPTPLNQFNNYADYLGYMPGAMQMDAYANMPVSGGPMVVGSGANVHIAQPGEAGAYQSKDFPGPYMWDRNIYHGLYEDVMNSPYQSMAMNAANEAAGMAGGWQFTPSSTDPSGIGNISQDPRGGFIQQDWMPSARRQYNDAAMMRDQAGVLFGQQQPLMLQQPRVTEQQDRLSQQQRMLMGLEDPLIQQAFDPQSQLYGRTVQQLQDQTRAASEAAGMGTTPYGAGVEGQTMANFNIDWQNNQLQRMLSGAQGVGGLAGGVGQLGGEIGQLAGVMTQLGQGIGELGLGGTSMLGQAGQTEQGAAGMQDMAAQALMTYGRAPQDTYNAILQNEMDATMKLGQFGQMSEQPYQQAFANWQDVQNQFLAANQQGFNQNQISGFEDPFSMLQLQSQIEMEREQMNMQAKMQEEQQKAQQKSQMMGMAGQGMSALGGMKGGI